MRSPTKIRTPTKLVRPRKTDWALRTKDVKKRLLEAGDGHLESALPAPKRVKLSQTHTITQTEVGAHSGEVPSVGVAVEAAEEAKGDEGYTGYSEGLHRRLQVAQCLEEDLLRDNARMRLKARSLRGEVDFYYGILARIELVAAETRRECAGKRNEKLEQVTRLVEQVQHIISASKPVADAMAAGESGEQEKE
ncbi:hypothetical protein PHYPSEUDO_012153 [Phytophthora pseudosyringae]|uniref:Uncharacterized protein n=1 Tax=Phytophthora pseudosyringae TaxID=221518 RepID=A0A8T1V764_9STRA|nr:hypothetical protein PHYPSEUDO_012153 [Phytophthora pseudosyringae]